MIGEEVCIRCNLLGSVAYMVLKVRNRTKLGEMIVSFARLLLLFLSQQIARD